MANAHVVYPTVCPGHTMSVWELHYASCAEGMFFISACQDKLPMLRDGATGDWIGTFEGHTGAVWSAKLSKDALLAVTGSADTTAKLWNGFTGELIHTFDHKRVVRTVDFSPDSSRIVTGGYETLVRVYDTAVPSAPPVTAEHPGGSRIKRSAWSRDGRCIYTGDEAGTVRMWDVREMRVVRQVDVVRGNKDGIMDFEVTAEGTLTVAGGDVVAMLSAADLSEKVRHTLKYDVEAASMHPNGRYFITGASDTRVHVHEVATGREVAQQKGHHGRVHAVRFAPGGETYSSGADDATIRLWKFDEAEEAGPAPSPPASSPLSASSPMGAQHSGGQQHGQPPLQQQGHQGQQGHAHPHHMPKEMPQDGGGPGPYGYPPAHMQHAPGAPGLGMQGSGPGPVAGGYAPPGHAGGMPGYGYPGGPPPGAPGPHMGYPPGPPHPGYPSHAPYGHYAGPPGGPPGSVLQGPPGGPHGYAPAYGGYPGQPGGPPSGPPGRMPPPGPGQYMGPPAAAYHDYHAAQQGYGPPQGPAY